jgi:hypothetical protein
VGRKALRSSGVGIGLDLTEEYPDSVEGAFGFGRVSVKPGQESGVGALDDEFTKSSSMCLQACVTIGSGLGRGT